MFTCTLHKNGMRKFAAAAVCSIVLAGAAFGIGVMNRGDAAETAVLSGAQKIEGAEDAAMFLKGFGIEADLATAQVGTVRIPRKWDDDFKAFNDVIRESGLDLARVKNKKADKWMLAVPALTTPEKNCFAVVLVCRGNACGAYLLEKPSGEVLPLRQAANPPAEPAPDAQQTAAVQELPAQAQTEPEAQQTAVVQELPAQTQTTPEAQQTAAVQFPTE